jgi:MFS family permease
MFGSALLRFALSLYVLDITGRADLFALLYAVSCIPLLLSPIGGAVADRVNRRNLLVGIALANAAVVAVLVVDFLGEGTPNIVVIGIAMVLFGATSAIEAPTVLACVPSLLSREKLEQGTGLTNAIGAIANLVAPVAGGILYGVLGVTVLVAASCVLFAIGAGLEMFIRIPATQQAQGKAFAATIVADLKEGFAFVAHQSGISKCLIIAALLNLVLLPFYIVGVPVIMRQGMQTSDFWYGTGMALIEAGMIIGALSVGAFVKWMHLQTLHRWLVAGAIGMFPMAAAMLPQVLSLGFFTSYILFFACAVPIMVMLGMLSIYVITNVQRHTPDNLMGKVMAIMMAASQCAAPIGQIVYGFFNERFSSAMYIPIIGVALATLALAFVTKWMMRNEGFDA